MDYQESTNLDGQGWPWCAAFVDWCIEQYLKEAPNTALKRPQTASAYGLLDWGRSNGCRVFTPNDKLLQAEPGDIVVYTFSHCGIVSKSPDGGFFRAIEGNTNADGGRDGYEVAERLRGSGFVMSFIRLP